MMLTPDGNTLIGANVASQYEQTLKRELKRISGIRQQLFHSEAIYGSDKRAPCMYRPLMILKTQIL